MIETNAMKIIHEVREMHGKLFEKMTTEEKLKYIDEKGSKVLDEIRRRREKIEKKVV